MANPNFWYAKKFKAYAEKTRHLCLNEHGAYNLLLDHYYETRGKGQAFALANGQAIASALLRVCMCQSDEERTAVMSVISQFFQAGSDGFLHNSAADEEMGISANVSAARSEAGKKGAEIKKQKAIAKENESKQQANASTNDKQSESKEVSKPQDNNSNNNNYSKQQDLTATPKVNTFVEPKALDVVVTIFEFWQKVMNSPRSVLDKNRKTLISNALKNYSPADICKAIRGCSKTPHNMGDNAQKTKYNGLNLILRNAEYIDKFIRNDTDQPRAASESVDDKNARVMREFLGAPIDENTVDMEGPT